MSTRDDAEAYWNLLETACCWRAVSEATPVPDADVVARLVADGITAISVADVKRLRLAAERQAAERTGRVLGTLTVTRSGMSWTEGE